jgi:glycerol-3-phosphate dehydrogenase
MVLCSYIEAILLKHPCILMISGQHNDARMNISIAVTATRLGATVANHVSVMDIVKERVGRTLLLCDFN